MREFTTGAAVLLGRELLANLPVAAVSSGDPTEVIRRPGLGRALRWDPEAQPAPLDALRWTCVRARGARGAPATVVAAFHRRAA